MRTDRAIKSLHAVLPRAVDLAAVIEPSAKAGSKPRWDAVVRIAGENVTVEWLRAGTLPAVQDVLARHPRPDVLVAPRMSAGAKAAASGAGVGWVDETGAAEIASPSWSSAGRRSPSSRQDRDAGAPATSALPKHSWKAYDPPSPP